MLEVKTLSYNILSDEYVSPMSFSICCGMQVIKCGLIGANLGIVWQAHVHAQELYKSVPRWCMDWKYRQRLLLLEIEIQRPDILALQEVDHFLDLQGPLEAMG